MTADRWTEVVRHQLGLGRLVPLGGPRDGAWITERAAVSALRRATDNVPGVRLGSLRLSLTDPEDVYEAAVPPPPSALPPGPLRISAEFAATLTPGEPLPTTASRLRAALVSVSTERLGLTVTEVDLRVTGLLDTDVTAQDVTGQDVTAQDEEDVHPDDRQPAEEPEPDTDESRVAAAALSVPGVTRLTRALGGLGRAVHIEERPGDTALPRRHVRVEIEVRAAERTLEVARAVRTTVTDALPDHPTVAVLVTAVTG
ncbi:nucleopolyhedrovirus P10 family protein [Streptomyces sp. 2A115]|uniref:nucleopolyhedrovirus P10 family protein n=1 Tax=Streptomyces sp. 2A115 TaxID=3457439 RepID=UPI003FD55C86